MNQRDQEEKKLRQEQKQGEKRQEVEQTSWLNSIMKSAAVTLERVQRRTRAFFSQGARKRQVVQFFAVVAVAILTGAALWLNSTTVLEHYSQEMTASLDGGQASVTFESEDGFSTGGVTLGLSPEELAAAIPSEASPQVEPALASPPERMSPEALAAMNLSKLQWPVQGEVVTEYGWWRHPMYHDWRMHPGIAIATPVNNPVKAALPGRVEEIYHDNYLGTVVVIEHGGSVRTVYGNVQDVPSLGSPVAQGQVIGKTASRRGDGQRGQLYFEVRHNGDALDPLAYLR